MHKRQEREGCWSTHWGESDKTVWRAQLKYTKGWGGNETQVKHIKVITDGGKLGRKRRMTQTTDKIKQEISLYRTDLVFCSYSKHRPILWLLLCVLWQATRYNKVSKLYNLITCQLLKTCHANVD